MNKDLKDFQNWIEKMKNDADDWVIYLVYQSKKNGKTYSGAMRWLSKNKPELPGKFTAAPSETVANVVRSIFEEAIVKVKKEGLDRKADDDD